MTKQNWINLVSKINQTEEDEFKAEYNSPELMWEKVVSKIFIKPDVIRQVCECESDYLQCNEFGKCPKCGKDWN